MLTDLDIKNLKPKETRYMVCDGDGLYIEVVPAGAKYWWLRYTCLLYTSAVHAFVGIFAARRPPLYFNI